MNYSQERENIESPRVRLVQIPFQLDPIFPRAQHKPSGLLAAPTWPRYCLFKRSGILTPPQAQTRHHRRRCRFPICGVWCFSFAFSSFFPHLFSTEFFLCLRQWFWAAAEKTNGQRTRDDKNGKWAAVKSRGKKKFAEENRWKSVCSDGAFR